MKPNVTAVVVTYDRPALLSACLRALEAQTRLPDTVLVVDNASPPATAKLVAERFPAAQLLRLDENLGGAGGFRAGMEAAFADGADWVWVMDDDAVPEPRALEALLAVAADHAGELVALASRLDDGRGAPPVDDGGRSNVREVAKAMFVGFAIPARVAATIGLPRADYFIYGDDTEYCLRLRRAGGRVLQVGDSVVAHVDWAANPANRTIVIAGHSLLLYPQVPAWKAYYLARNRILTGRSYGATRLVRGLAQSIAYLVLSLVFAPQVVGSVSRGVVDGVRGRSGKVRAPAPVPASRADPSVDVTPPRDASPRP